MNKNEDQNKYEDQNKSCSDTDPAARAAAASAACIYYRALGSASRHRKSTVYVFKYMQQNWQK